MMLSHPRHSESEGASPPWHSATAKSATRVGGHVQCTQVMSKETHLSQRRPTFLQDGAGGRGQEPKSNTQDSHWCAPWLPRQQEHASHPLTGKSWVGHMCGPSLHRRSQSREAACSRVQQFRQVEIQNRPLLPPSVGSSATPLPPQDHTQQASWCDSDTPARSKCTSPHKCTTKESESPGRTVPLGILLLRSVLSSLLPPPFWSHLHVSYL